MKYTEFTYAKANGETSKRAIVVTSEPNKFLCGIEVDELYNDEYADFVKEYKQLQDKQNQERQDLFAKYELKHSYRQFDPARITNQTVEWI